MWFRRFKGMIKPGMGASYEDAYRISAAKSIWVVDYLRARRVMNSLPLNDRIKSDAALLVRFYRRKHFDGN